MELTPGGIVRKAPAVEAHERNLREWTYSRDRLLTMARSAGSTGVEVPDPGVAPVGVQFR